MLIVSTHAENAHEEHQGHVINWLSLCLALIDAGVITAEQINATRGMAVEMADQEIAAIRDEVPDGG